MSDDIQKETERIHQGIVESLSFSEALAKRDAEIDRLRGLLAEIGKQHRKLAGLVRGAQVPLGANDALDVIERCVNQALGE